MYFSSVNIFPEAISKYLPKEHTSFLFAKFPHAVNTEKTKTKPQAKGNWVVLWSGHRLGPETETESCGE